MPLRRRITRRRPSVPPEGTRASGTSAASIRISAASGTAVEASLGAVGKGQFHLDPSSYLNAVRAEVPAYDELQKVVAQATVGLRVRRVLDLGTGTGETAARVLVTHPGAAVTAIDASADMVAVASRALPEADVRVGRLEDALPKGPFDLVVSCLAVHHLPGHAKAELFRRVSAVLVREGRFVLGDVIVPNDGADVVTPLEPGVDLPDRLEEQLQWLSQAGLVPRVVWQHRDLAVVVADAS